MEASIQNANKKKRFAKEITTNLQSSCTAQDENVAQLHCPVLNESVALITQNQQQFLNSYESAISVVKTDVDSIVYTTKDIVDDTKKWKVSPEKSHLSQQDVNEKVSKTKSTCLSTPPISGILQIPSEPADLILPRQGLNLVDADATSSITGQTQPAFLDDKNVSLADGWKLHIGIESCSLSTQTDQEHNHCIDSEKALVADTASVNHISHCASSSNKRISSITDSGSQSSKSEEYYTEFNLRVLVVIIFKIIFQLAESTCSYILGILLSAFAAYVSTVTWVMSLPFRVTVYLFCLVSRTILTMLTILLNGAAMHGGAKIAEGINGHVEAN